MPAATKRSLADVDIAATENFVEEFPYWMFDLLREQDPLHWHEDPYTGVPFWAVTKHEDVVHVSRHPELFSSWRRSSFFREPGGEGDDDLEHLRMQMVNQDPPEHTRLRSIVNKGFTPRMIGRLEDRIRQYAHAIIDKAEDEGVGDFVRLVSAELPLEVIAELMGAPLEDRDFIFRKSNELIATTTDDPEWETDPDSVQASATEMYLYAEKLRQEREAEPRDDILSRLAHAEVDGEKLSDMEFDLFFILLAIAGNETTRNAISHGMKAFIDHPDQWEKLRREKEDDPHLLQTAADEVIRWAHPIIQFRRTATQDVELRGKTIREDDKVVLYYASANRDEDVFEDPYRFDITREPNPHISFGGGGPHFCLGAHLAKLEVAVMFDVLSDRLPDIELDGPIRRLQSHFVHGIKQMPVRFTAGAHEGAT